jgi:hypothetical protein
MAIRSYPRPHGAYQKSMICRAFVVKGRLPENRGVAGSIPALAIFVEPLQMGHFSA